MNLKEVSEWIALVDARKYDPLKRARIDEYKKMIIERIGLINQLSGKLQRYMTDVEEFVAALSKIGVKLHDEPAPVEEKKPEAAKKQSPLLPW